MIKQYIKKLSFSSNKKDIFDIVQLESEFHIEKKLGSGAFGSVFQATNITSGQQVAIKQINYTNKTKKLIDREVKYMAIMHHENIAELVRAFRPTKQSKIVYIAMELCNGGELFDAIIQHEHLSESIAKQVSYEMLSAIEYSHSRRVAHMDLKPENIVLSAPWEGPGQRFPPIKLIDWGLASSFDEFSKCPCSAKGSPAYIAPEVLLGQYSQSADIWAIGVIVYIMMCGDMPFYGQNNSQLFDSIKNRKPTFLDKDGWGSVSKKCIHFIKKLLIKSPEMRPNATSALRLNWFSSDVDTVRPETSLIRLRRYAHQCKLKKLIMLDIAQRTNTASAIRAASIFKKIAGQETKISMPDLRRGILEYIGKDDVLDLSEIIRGLDLNDDQFVDVNEFIVSMLAPHYTTRERLQRFFMDNDMINKLTVERIALFIGGRSKAMKCFRSMDVDQNGVISMEEFVNWLLDESS